MLSHFKKLKWEQYKYNKTLYKVYQVKRHINSGI
jgi:hypothetical protein